MSLTSPRNIYIRSMVVDGNFKADHIKQKNPEDDVFLTNGELFMTATDSYNKHLEEATKLAPRYKQVNIDGISEQRPFPLTPLEIYLQRT